MYLRSCVCVGACIEGSASDSDWVVYSMYVGG